MPWVRILLLVLDTVEMLWYNRCMEMTEATTAQADTLAKVLIRQHENVTLTQEAFDWADKYKIDTYYMEDSNETVFVLREK